MNKNTGYSDVNAAIKDFEKKFKDKTKNDWKNRASFKPVPGKYTMIEMAGEEEDEVDVGHNLYSAYLLWYCICRSKQMVHQCFLCSLSILI